MTNPIGGNSGCFEKQIAKNLDNILNGSSSDSVIAKKIGNKLVEAEEAYLKAVTEGDADPGKLKEMELKYQKLLAAFEGFSKMLEAKFQTMMQGIRNFRVS